jgi:hypothetical protein
MQLIAWPIEFPRNILLLTHSYLTPCVIDPDVQSRAGSYVENSFTWPWRIRLRQSGG